MPECVCAYVCGCGDGGGCGNACGFQHVSVSVCACGVCVGVCVVRVAVAIIHSSRIIKYLQYLNILLIANAVRLKTPPWDGYRPSLPEERECRGGPLPEVGGG